MTSTSWYGFTNFLRMHKFLTPSVSKIEEDTVSWNLSLNMLDTEGQDGWGVLCLTLPGAGCSACCCMALRFRLSM